MTTATIDPERDRTAAPSRETRRLGAMALFAALYTYALIVFGGIVRITGSGMGCGDDWPRCNGEWIPPFTLETLIEYTHRLLAAGIGIVVLAVFLYAVMQRARPGVGGPHGALRPLLLGAVLLVVQVVLGAVTVRLELPASVTVLHFVTALLFMATLIVAAVRARTFGSPDRARDARAARSAWGMALAAAALGFAVVTFGALTANVPGAPQACSGFPLCTGRWLPEPTVPAMHVHWGHRLIAFLMAAYIAAAAFTARRGASSAVKRAAAITLALVVHQLVVAAVLVLLFLPPHVQAAHLAVGAAIWFALVCWAALARRVVLAQRA